MLVIRRVGSVVKALCLLAFSVAMAVPLKAETKMVRPNPDMVEIHGGEGARAWTLRYGVQKTDVFQPQFAFSENLAWYAEGEWVRRIDTVKGMVTGRWRFPGYIVALQAKDSKVTVGFENSLGRAKTIRTTIEFDPDHPAIPEWPTGMLLVYRVPEKESLFPLALEGRPLTSDSMESFPSERKKAFIAQIEEVRRRDQFSPWLAVTLGGLLKAEKDPRAQDVFKQALQIKTDFTEYLPMSAQFSRMGEWEISRAEFEAGYADFIRRGYDPRLNTFLIGRLILYNLRLNQIPPERLREHQERIFKFSPYSEGAEIASQLQAMNLLQSNPVESQLWQARALEAKEKGNYVLFPELTLRFDRTIQFLLACGLAALLFLLLMRLRYASQAALDASKRSTSGWKHFLTRLTTVQYWSRAERYAFLSIILAGWATAGYAGAENSTILRFVSESLDHGMGSYAGPLTRWHFAHRLPPGREQDLRMAISYHQSGELDEAEKMYRTLPDFAEAWNNLGAILRSKGTEQEANQAFERALQLEPTMAEAKYNLGRQTDSLWVKIHDQYLPHTPMLTIPSREHYLRAYFHATGWRAGVAMLKGPFGGALSTFMLSTARELGATTFLGAVYFGLPIITAALFVLLLPFAIISLFAVPYAEVTQSPLWWHKYVEMMVPGAAPAWGVFAGAAIISFAHLLVYLALWKLTRGNAAVLTDISLPNLVKSFGVTADIWRFFRPHWFVQFGIVGAVYVLNTILVWHSSRRLPGKTRAVSVCRHPNGTKSGPSPSQTACIQGTADN